MLDLKPGAGRKVATAGQRCAMEYVGRLGDARGREFDRSRGGRPLVFRLGAGEVIKGWDVGVAGMRVGGRRRIVCPPGAAYGNRALPKIPPNSTLCFDVKLVDCA